MRILVVGGGYSGTAVSANILRLINSSQDVQLTLLERADTVGEGAAYGTKRREHLLNVPAAGMSCFPDHPDHLLKWLEAHAFTTELGVSQRQKGSFIPRQVYAAYLKHTLEHEVVKAPASQFRRVQDEAVRASVHKGEELSVELASGKSLKTDRLVLCLGNEPSTWPFPIQDEANPRLIPRPWSFNPADISRQASVLVVGTGLTMADVITSLSHNKHQGPITAISRRGILPKSHKPGVQPLQYSFKDRQRSASELFWEVLERAARHTSLGGDWREAVDGLRPWTVRLWRSLGPEDKRELLTKGKAAWDVHRHRIAPEIHGIVARELEEGRLTVLAGRVEGLKLDEHGRVAATLKLEQEGATQERSFDHVVNCTGPNQNVHKSQNPLLQNLVAQESALPGSSGVCIQVSEAGRLVSSQGELDNVWVVGPQLIDRDFESIAVPELRQQAQTAAQGVLGLSAQPAC